MIQFFLGFYLNSEIVNKLRRRLTMKKVSLLVIATVFMLTGNAFAQLSEPVIVDQLGVDCEWHYYVHNSLGPRIAVDENGAVHVVYRKAWAAVSDTGYALYYANVTAGTKEVIPPQKPEMLIKPSRVFIGGGRGNAPLFIYYGISTYNFQWGDMPLQAMAKVDENGKVVPLGEQPDRNYYHEPYYALPISMEIDHLNGMAHCILTNVDGQAISYWNFDGTNFGEIYAMYNKYPDQNVPGKDVPARFLRNATKGADLAITKDGSTVAVGGLHPWNNIDITYGSFGGEIWPDDPFTGMDEGSFVFLFDTTNVATGDNIDHSMAMPATDLQLAYDDNDVLHIVYEAAWFSQYLDTLSNEGFKARNNGVDKWTSINGWNWTTTYYYLAGDENAVYYGSGKPKPQILYWNSTMPLMASSTAGHVKIAESVYPKAGEEYKWWFKANIDSGVGVWSNRADCIIDEVDLVINTDAQPGEPKGIVVWTEMGSDPIIIEDSDLRYVGYYRDILVSVTEDFINWTTPINLTNTPEIDESEVSAYQDVVDGKVHFVYNSDNLPMSDYFLNWTQAYADKFIFGPTQRANPADVVNLNYATIDVNAIMSDVEDHQSVRPGEFELAQNYPNPFNPTTSIKYTVPAGNVKLEVYNMLGQKIKTLIDKEVAAGSYDIVWDGMDYTGKQVASGVYFYKLKSDAGVKIRKMVLQK